MEFVVTQQEDSQPEKNKDEMCHYSAKKATLGGKWGGRGRKNKRSAACSTAQLFPASIEFFNNSDAILNFENIAMHCGLSRVILLF